MWSGRGERTVVWHSREGRRAEHRAEHFSLPGDSRLEARAARESASVGLTGGSAAPLQPWQQHGFPLLGSKTGLLKIALLK